MSDGLYGREMPSPATMKRYPLATSRSSSPDFFAHTLQSPHTMSAMSLMDGPGEMQCDRTNSVPNDEASKVWCDRSMPHMADAGALPAGLPHGLTDNEKKLWLAIYCRSRELLKSGKESVRGAVDAAVLDVTEKHSLEYRFAVRWQHSIKSCLAMRLPYRSSDVYS